MTEHAGKLWFTCDAGGCDSQIDQDDPFISDWARVQFSGNKLDYCQMCIPKILDIASKLGPK